MQSHLDKIDERNYRGHVTILRNDQDYLELEIAGVPSEFRTSGVDRRIQEIRRTIVDLGLLRHAGPLSAKIVYNISTCNDQAAYPFPQDLTKLMKFTLSVLKGSVYKNIGSVCEIEAEKKFSLRDATHVVIAPCNEDLSVEFLQLCPPIEGDRNDDEPFGEEGAEPSKVCVQSHEFGQSLSMIVSGFPVELLQPSDNKLQRNVLKDLLRSGLSADQELKGALEANFEFGIPVLQKDGGPKISQEEVVTPHTKEPDIVRLAWNTLDAAENILYSNAHQVTKICAKKASLTSAGRIGASFVKSSTYGQHLIDEL